MSTPDDGYAQTKRLCDVPGKRYFARWDSMKRGKSLERGGTKYLSK